MATSNPQPRPNRTFYIDVPVIKGISLTFRPKNTQNADRNASKVKVASLQPLQTSKSVNQLINRKRGRDDDEKNAKDAPQKRRQLQQVEKKPIQKLKADTAVPPKASNVITKDAPVKKPIVKKAPQPLWTRVGVDFTRQEVEDRIMLREFTLRFNSCLGIKRNILEKLEDFGTFDDVVAKAILLSMIETIKADSPSDERRLLNEFVGKVRGRGMSFYDILCHLQQLRHKTGLNIPNLVNDLKVEPHTINADALIPVMLGLIDDLLQTRAVRSELDKFKTEMADVRKGYYAAVKEEKERWAGIRVPMMEEKKKGGPSYDAEKWKKKFEAAKAKHDANEHAIKFDYVKNQAAIAPRYTPLVDKEGRTYYIHTPSTRKPPAKSSRDEFMKWTWFVAVWGKLPEDAKRIDIPSDVKKDEEGWLGFGEAAECELLAKWIQFKAEEAEETERAASSKNSSDDDSSELTEEEEDGDEDGDARVADSKRLVAALLDFADVLRYADDTLGK
ncbi:hypothetical protein FS842_004675 [Serendipita sp. 407]|nr:hypothetical protein FS842_004675 [Serendipita sp. 407]